MLAANCSLISSTVLGDTHPAPHLIQRGGRRSYAPARTVQRDTYTQRKELKGRKENWRGGGRGTCGRRSRRVSCSKSQRSFSIAAAALLLGPLDGLRERGGDGGGGVPLVCLVVLWPFEEEEEEEGVLTVAGEGKRRYYGMEE